MMMMMKPNLSATTTTPHHNITTVTPLQQHLYKHTNPTITSLQQYHQEYTNHNFIYWLTFNNFFYNTILSTNRIITRRYIIFNVIILSFSQ